MVWVILGLAVVAFGVAALAATGRLGEMPPPVDGLYPGRIPSPLTPEAAGDVRFARQLNGYETGEVDAALAAVASGDLCLDPGALSRSGAGRIGYRRCQVDQVFAELARVRNNGACSQSSRNEGTHGSDEATHW